MSPEEYAQVYLFPYQDYVFPTEPSGWFHHTRAGFSLGTFVRKDPKKVVTFSFHESKLKGGGPHLICYNGCQLQ